MKCPNKRKEQRDNENKQEGKYTQGRNCHPWIWRECEQISIHSCISHEAVEGSPKCFVGAGESESLWGQKQLPALWYTLKAWGSATASFYLFRILLVFSVPVTAPQITESNKPAPLAPRFLLTSEFRCVFLPTVHLTAPCSSLGCFLLCTSPVNSQCCVHLMPDT